MTDRRPEEPVPDDFRDSAKRSQQADIADESASYTNAMAEKKRSPDGDGETATGRSSEAPAEGSEEAAPRQPGSPGLRPPRHGPSR